MGLYFMSTFLVVGGPFDTACVQARLILRCKNENRISWLQFVSGLMGSVLSKAVKRKKLKIINSTTVFKLVNLLSRLVQCTYSTGRPGPAILIPNS